MTQSAETTAQLSAILNSMVAEAERHAQQVRADVQHFQEVWLQMGGDVKPVPERVVFCSPVTGVVSTTSNPYGLSWADYTGYCTLYNSSSGAKAYHTGADLNLPAFSDSGEPVFAAADGDIVFVGTVPGWQGQVVVIKHTLEDGRLVWTRYAHISEATQIGRMRLQVKRGDVIGVIADYTPKGSPAGDHLHFDVCWDDLGARPGDWPGMDKARIEAQYVDPAKWLREHSG